MNKPLLIGIGNEYRGDDSVGIEVTRTLEKRLKPTVDVTYCDGDTIHLMELWKERESVFLIDAILSQNNEVGKVKIFLPHKEKIPTLFAASSTHLLDVGATIELAQTLDNLPKECVLYGIEATDFSIEHRMSQELKEKLTEITKTIEEDIRKKLCMK